MLQLSPNPAGIQLLLDPELDRLRETHGDISMPPAPCITCHGAGTFRWRAPNDPTAIADYECNCKEQWALYAYLLHSGIEKLYQRLSWQDLGAEPGAIAAVLDYLDSADFYVDSGSGLILYGEMGTGKTMLSTLLLKRLLGQGIKGYFVPFPRMVTLFTEGWRDNEKAAWFRQRIENAQVLVMDDVGRETMTKQNEGGVLKDFATSVVGSTFDAVLRHRIAAAKPTILTTNFDLDKLKSGYGSNIFSLLGERSSTYRFTGADFRSRLTERNTFERTNRLTRPVVIG